MRVSDSRTFRNARVGMTAASAIAVALTWATLAQQPVSAGKPAAGPAKCADVRLKVTILPIDVNGDTINDSVLGGDGKGAIYQDRVDGVYNTVLHLCPASSATFDATMGLINSKRSMTFRFPAPIAGSAENPPPAWVPGTITVKPFMNVRNILWGRQNHSLSFTTGMGFSYFKGPGDSSDYRLQFLPPVTDAEPGDPTANTPYEAASVTVQDVPGTCRSNPTGGTLDSWTVTVNRSADALLAVPAPFAGTLRRDTNSGAVQVGQYDMPFQLKLEALTCVPASVSGGY